MKRLFHFIVDRFLSNKLDFRVRLFNVLAMAGMVSGFVMGLTNAINGGGLVSVFTDMIGSTALSFVLLMYAYKTGRYKQCYLVTIAAIFLIYFPSLFFRLGGFQSGQWTFFIFGIIFSAYMLEGKTAWITIALEIIVYIGIFIFAFNFPESVKPLPSAIGNLISLICNFTFVSVILSITLTQHLAMYNKQQKDLEAAREEALELSRAKSNFLANMSHEIRTPINVMLGMNEMILRKSDSEHVKGYSNKIQSAGKTLLSLINNVLDVSKIESGKLNIVKESYKTADLIRDLSIVGEEQAARYSLAFQVKVNEALPQSFIGDIVHIKQVVVNFLSNAAKYTKQGSVTLEVDTRQTDKADERLLCISVTDTGIGIKEENLAILFDAFMRADLPSNRYIEGTGLGLAITKELTELMDGHIRVQSKWGEGSVFSVEIPQSVEDFTPLGKVMHYAGGTQPLHDSFIAPNARILVVDDNKENQEVVRALLSRTMLQVDTAENGEACIAAATLRNYDVILMDYMMPNMDGLQTLQQLKKLPDFATPVIVLTANVVAGTKEKLLSAGFAQYLSKPIMWRDLEAALTSVIPPDKVTLSNAVMDYGLTQEERVTLEQELSLYGITMSNGLHYLNGNIAQYKTLASFFVENYMPARTEIYNYADIKDFGMMRYSVHSLKSKAFAMGADSLANTAAKLERLCNMDNNKVSISEHITLALPLLYYEWEQACMGLRIFINRIEMSSVSLQTPTASTAHAAIDELLPLLKRNRQLDALELLDDILAYEADNATLDTLCSIRKCVDTADFREAEDILLKYMSERGVHAK